VTDADRERFARRVLVLAPLGQDAALTQSVLERAGVACYCCADLAQVCLELEAGAGAVLMVEEAVIANGDGCLAAWLGRQPPWSDLPILVLARSGADSTAIAQSMDVLGNVTVLERPTRVAALVSAVRTALRARQRQYQIRDYLVERERSIETQSLLAAIVASSDDAIISRTLEGKILTWNAGAERIFGYSAAEVMGRPITMLMPPERQIEEANLLERLRQGERIEHFETVRVAKDGRRLDISLTVSPIRDGNGNIIGTSKVARDITERKQAEAVLREADRRKDEFLAILAHELRNPLAPIRNSLHILRLNSRHDPAAERVGEIMERQVNHMVRLVDDLMEISRITRGKLELRKELIEVAAVVRSAVETSRPQIEAAGHQLAVALPPEPLTLEGDTVRLTQIVANLLNNAAKYTDAGGQIWLTVRREGDRVMISVRDTGTGIPPEMLPRVFELFTQVDRHAGRSQGGLGIGLTLVKRLAEMHGGNVVAHSEGTGRGSEFVVRLPLADHPYPTARAGSEADSPPVLTPRRVLIVDDNHDAADSLGMLLKLLGSDVQVVYNGPDALEALVRYQPAVVLLDIGMPGMDGYEVARRIRQEQLSRNVTLIALTGWGQEADRKRTQIAGFDYHLIKPPEISTLQSLLISLDRAKDEIGPLGTQVD
jgi:PAS domain S-box-containing protein